MKIDKDKILLAAIFIIFFFIRLSNLGTHPQHVDESYAIIASDNSFSEIIRILKTKDPHPPLYYSFMKVWIFAGKKFGMLPDTPITSVISPPQDTSSMFFLRIPNVVLSFLTLIILYLFGLQIYSKITVFAAMIIFTFSQMEIFWAQSVRYYTLIMLLASVSTYLFYNMLLEQMQSDGQKIIKSKKLLMYEVFYILVSAAGFYTNYFMSLIIFSHFFYLLLIKKINIRWIIRWIIIAFIFCAWMPVLISQMGIVGADTYGTAKVNLSSIPLTLYRLIFSYGLEAETPVTGLGYFIALILLGVILYFSVKVNKLIIWIYAFTPIIILFAFSLRKPLFSTAYFLISFPGYCLFLGKGIEEILSRLKIRKYELKNQGLPD